MDWVPSVRVKVGNETQSAMAQSGSSYLSQSERILTFGLGKADRRIAWKSAGQADRSTGSPTFERAVWSRFRKAGEKRQPAGARICRRSHLLGQEEWTRSRKMRSPLMERTGWCRSRIS